MADVPNSVVGEGIFEIYGAEKGGYHSFLPLVAVVSLYSDSV
jgi:hypothetical protein